MKRIVRWLADPRFLLSFLLLFNRCSTSSEARRDLSKPDLAIHVAALSMSGVSRRLEKDDVADLVKILKRERVEVLVVNGLTRYPGVRTRVDLVEDLAAAAEMRQAFGEMMNNAGRQTVNVVFSTYPIRSSDRQSFDGIASAEFEGAVHAFVDGGVRDIQVVGAQFPSKAPADEQWKCVQMIASKKQTKKRTPVIVAGNLPSSESTRKAGSFEDTQAIVGNLKAGAPRIWYNGEGLLFARSGRTVNTGLGVMSVVEFALFRE